MKPSFPSSPMRTTTTITKPSSPSSLLLLPPLLYEPTSVLDPLLDLPPLPSFDPPPPPLLLDDPLILSCCPVDLLLRAAFALDSHDHHLSLTLLTRLHHLLPSPAGPPLVRSAFYFKEVLISSSEHMQSSISPFDIVRKIAAFRTLSDLSPIPQFASFTANQAVLEALLGGGGTPPIRIHLVDFDLGLGGQWSSFLQEIAARGGQRAPQPSVRITAVVPEESPEAVLAAENLREFAAGLGIRLSAELIRPSAAGTVGAASGEVAAVVFPPSAAAAAAGVVRRVGARVAVMVDWEPWCVAAGEGFGGKVAAGVEWYAAAMEAVEAAAGVVGRSEGEVEAIEGAVVRERVAASVRAYAGEAVGWAETMEAAGMRAAEMSEYTEAQARCIARGAVAAGYAVGRREEGLVLSWHGVDMAATYAWRR